MRSTRIYQDTQLISGSDVPLSENARHHLVNVLRCKQGQQVLLFNGREEREAHGWISHITKKTCTIRIDRITETQRESPLKITLAQAISAGDRMDFTLQKAVELGVTNVQPIYTERSQRPLKAGQAEKKLRHWQGVVTHACEQSGRCLRPTLHAPQQFEGRIKTPANGTRLALTPNATTPLQDIVISEETEIEIFVGPEGGFSDEELEFISQQDIQPIRLGPRILRTETAGIAMISWLQVQHGDLGKP